MRILFMIGHPLASGGHVLSALCLGKRLCKLGHKIILLAPDGPLKNEFEKQGIEVVVSRILPRSFYRNLLAIFEILRICWGGKIDLIHAQDFVALRPCSICSNLCGIRLVFTKAGGETPQYRIPPVDSLVVYSKELYDGMSHNYPDLTGSINLIKARIDTEIFRSERSSTFKKNLENSSRSEPLRVFMAMRFENAKRGWLEAAMNCMDILAGYNRLFIFCLAGGGSLWEQFHKMAKRINSKHEQEIVRLLGPVTQVDKMVEQYNLADVVIGHGRGILEAMACGKPVIVLGKQDRATLIQDETVELVSEYNFSGRHITAYPQTLQNLVTLLRRFIESSVDRRELGSFSRRYIDNNYAAHIGSQQLASLYSKTPLSPHLKRYSRLAKWIVDECRERLWRRQPLFGETNV